MGCSASSIPNVIIPDPTEGQKCNVLFKKTGMFARDQNVFQDGDKDKKWLMMDKEGSLFSNPTYTLENFVRRDGEKRGEVLVKAKLKVTECKSYGHECHEDSDSSSEDSDEEVEVTVVKMKWAQAIKVKFYSDRDMNNEIAEIKVKAKGKAKKTTITTTVEDKDADGNVTGTHEDITYDIDKKIKKLKYVVTEMKGVEQEDLPKIELHGKPNKSAYKLEWGGPIFQAAIDSNGWGSQEIYVKTGYKNPALGMLMGYIIAKEISPDDVLDKVSVF